MNLLKKRIVAALGTVAIIATTGVVASTAMAETPAWDSLSDQEKHSSYGFFIWKSENAEEQDDRDSAADAANKLTTAVLAEYTHIGQDKDATTLDNFQEALAEAQRINEFRSAQDDEPCRTDLPESQGQKCDDASKRLEPLQVNDILMAIAQSNANFSANIWDHASKYGAGWNVGENLSQGPLVWDGSTLITVKPALRENCKVGQSFSACNWYWSEKVTYDNDPSDSSLSGHYQNLTNKGYEYTLTGVGINSGPSSSNTVAQEYSNESFARYNNQIAPNYDVAAYANEVSAYVDLLDNTPDPNEITGLTANPGSITVDADKDATGLDLSGVTVTANYGNGTSATVSPVWDPLTADQLAALRSHTGGGFDIYGTVSGDFASGVSNRVRVKVGVPTSTATVVIKDTDATETSVTTPSGTAPVLLTTATVTWSNGEIIDESIDWPTIAESKYSDRNGGTFGVYAYVEGTMLTTHVTVTAATVQFVDPPTTVTTVVQVAPQLPENVRVHWSNDDVSDEPVTWDAVDPSQYATVNETGFAVNGTVFAGTDHEQQVTVTVRVASSKIKEVSDSTFTVTVASGESDVSAQLPDSTTVTYTNDQTEAAAITWDALTDAQQAIVASRDGGEFTVHGTVSGVFDDGVDSSVSATVTVTPATVTSVAMGNSGSIVSVEVASGATADDLIRGLPETATVTWSNGDTTSEAIDWPQLTSDQSAKLASRTGGDFQLTTTVRGETLMAKVSVLPATVESVADLDPVTTAATVAPTLPTTVEVTWSNGEVTDETIAWALSADDYATRGEKTVSGTILNGTQRVSIQLTVTATITDVTDPDDVTVESGTDPTSQFPQMVTVTYSDDETSHVAVTWDAVSRSDYAKRDGGDFTVDGTVDGTNIKAHQTVHVNPAIITDVTPPTQVTAIKGGAHPTLPGTVDATYSNGDSDVPVAVTWDDDNVQYDTVGTYIASGTVAGWSTPVSLTVVVADATVTDVTDPDDIIVDAFAHDATPTTTDLGIPGTVTATLSNGSTADVAVTWDGLTADQIATLTSRAGGDFNVTGTVSGTDKTVTASVTVNPATATGVVDANITVTTTVGTAPTLPATIQVRWSNGDVTGEPVTWDAFDATQYANEGTFTVSGTVTVADPSAATSQMAPFEQVTALTSSQEELAQDATTFPVTATVKVIAKSSDDSNQSNDKDTSSTATSVATSVATSADKLAATGATVVLIVVLAVLAAAIGTGVLLYTRKHN